jgi:ATP-dependent DNA helicase PIF1
MSFALAQGPGRKPSQLEFPVTNAYAITVHKAQGITVERAVLNLSSRDFVPGLSYVAVSRVKTLRGILFEESFDYERFRVRQNETVSSRNADRERRADQHIGLQDIPIFSSSPLRR